MSIPKKDSLLVPYSTNVNTRIVASPGTFQLSAAQATAYTAVHAPYIAAVSAMMEAREAGNRQQSLTDTRNTTKKALLAYGRQLYTTIQSNPAVSDANKTLLGIHVRSMPTPTPVPAHSPGLTIVSVDGRRVKARVFDTQVESKRGKPPGVSAAAVYTFVGALAPADPGQYEFQGLTTKTTMDIDFAPTVPTGSTVWISATWMNPRGQFGQASAPVSFTLQGGAARARAA